MMKGCGVFFNQIVDLERIYELCQPTAEAPTGYIDWIAPLMAPDQSAVQNNRRDYMDWRNRLPAHVKFIPWIACDDPEVDYESARWVVDNYPSDGILLNAEYAYQGAGRWKSSTIMQRMSTDPKLISMPKILSYNAPADRTDMDFRAWERAGCWFAPQAYWLDASVNTQADLTPLNQYRMAYLPEQLHPGWDYRLLIKNSPVNKHWGRIVQWDGSDVAIVKDFVSAKLHRFKVVAHDVQGYKFMTAGTGRKLYDYKTGKIETGQLLGFQIRELISPTVGVYPNCYPTPAQITTELGKISILKGASLYLGDTSTSDHVKAVWRSIDR